MKKIRVRVVFFDLDGTLVWVPGNSQADWVQKTLNRFGFYPTKEALVRAYKIAEQRWHQQVQPTMGFTSESFTEWNKMILEELGIQVELIKMAKQIQNYWNTPADQLFADVTETLETLKQKEFRLGIVTHRPSEGVEHFLKKHNLAHYFEWKTNPSAVAPHGKLDRALWEPLLKSARIRADEALHIGDDFETDVRGARRAGLHAVWIDRTELAGKLYLGRLSLTRSTDHAPSHEQACAKVGDLKQLIELIEVS